MGRWRLSRRPGSWSTSRWCRSGGNAGGKHGRVRGALQVSAHGDTSGPGGDVRGDVRELKVREKLAQVAMRKRFAWCSVPLMAIWFGPVNRAVPWKIFIPLPVT